MQELRIKKKQLVFGPTLAKILPIFGEHKKGKLYVLKKVGLSTFKEMLQKYVYNSTVTSFNIILFCLKEYSEILNVGLAVIS